MGRGRRRGNSKGNNTIKQLRAQKGMTLLEVAIALFVLAIGLLGLAGLQLVVLQSDSLGHEATLATTLAKAKLAELQKATPPGQRATSGITQGADHYLDQAKGVTYTREWSVQNNVPHESQDIWPTGHLRVIVRVSWKDTWADRCVTVSAGGQYSEVKSRSLNSDLWKAAPYHSLIFMDGVSQSDRSPKGGDSRIQGYFTLPLEPSNPSFVLKRGEGEGA